MPETIYGLPAQRHFQSTRKQRETPDRFLRLAEEKNESRLRRMYSDVGDAIIPRGRLQPRTGAHLIAISETGLNKKKEKKKREDKKEAHSFAAFHGEILLR